LRGRIEDVLDTVTALQRAEWLHDGIYVGPAALPAVYREQLGAARKLRVAVPPVVVCGVPARSQGAFGTEARAFVALSATWLERATPQETSFILGRSCGHIQARQVTGHTLYAVLVDGEGLRAVARRAVGPLLELALAPIGLAARVALSRWHRAAELSADRAGLLVCGSVESAGIALLRASLLVRPKVSLADYLAQLRAARADAAPGRWAELLTGQPWVHKRLAALDLFARSALYGTLSGVEIPVPIPDDELDRRTSALLGTA
jgi:Zn-dependent protease with chaperone function